MAGGDEQDAMVGHAVREAGAPGAPEGKRDKRDVSDRDAVVLGSGNLGLVYLMDVPRRMTLEEIDERHPDLIPALREHPHIGWLLVRSAEHGALVLGRHGSSVRLADGRVEGDDPLAPFGPTAARHLARTDAFPHCADLMIGSFYDPETEEGCAFEELISFHGGLGGPADPPVRALPGRRPRAPRAAARRRRGGARPPHRVALGAPAPRGRRAARARGRGAARLTPGTTRAGRADPLSGRGRAPLPERPRGGMVRHDPRGSRVRRPQPSSPLSPQARRQRPRGCARCPGRSRSGGSGETA